MPIIEKKGKNKARGMMGSILKDSRFRLTKMVMRKLGYPPGTVFRIEIVDRKQMIIKLIPVLVKAEYPFPPAVVLRLIPKT